MLKKVVLRLSEHDGVIEKQTKRFAPPQSFLANSVPDSIVQKQAQRDFISLLLLQLKKLLLHAYFMPVYACQIRYVASTETVVFKHLGTGA